MKYLGILIALWSFQLLGDEIVGGIYHTGLLKHPNSQHLGETHVKITDCDNLPANFDLRDLGVVPPIRDQGQCGSCWAFSKTGSLESSLLASGGKAIDLSEQELVSCDSNNYGCSGGDLNSTEYQISHGQGLESDFPYEASNTRCKTVAVAAKGVGSGFVHVGSPNSAPSDKDVQCAIYKSHTIPWITVSATGSWSRGFPSTLDTPYAHCGHGQINHAVGVIGWKTVNNKIYYIMKNSWGTSWGAQGYGLLALGCDSFGDEVAYIQTNVMPCKTPTPKLPVEIDVNSGDSVYLSVNAEDGVKYEWDLAGKKVADGASFSAVPADKETIYTVIGTNSCGTGQSSVKVKIIQ